jgi:lipoprotein NlpI
MEWLRPKVPPPLLEPLGMFAFAQQADPVVWGLASAPEGTGETADYCWLMRAASSVRSRDSDPAHQAALRQRFEVDRPQFYHQVGRYLLGLSSEQTVIAAATTSQSRQELPFFLGFKAQVEGRYADAVTWYRAAVETGEPRMGEYRWSYDELSRLRSAELSLERMKADKL